MIDELARGFLNQGGVVGILILFVIGLVKEWWIMGATVKRDRKHYQELLAASERRENQWMRIALHGTSMAERLVDVADRTFRPREHSGGNGDEP